jgi:dTDP-4-amino-4,6-dideoxy-D-galactose acyltransferase
MKIELLEWDSDFFGIKTGRFFLSKETGWDENELKNWDLVYIFVEPADMSNNLLLQQKGVPLVDEKITYIMNVSKVKETKDNASHIYSYFSSTNDEKVISIGIQSGIYSRFNIDPNFSKAKFKELYAMWMKKSINREIANEVVVYTTEENEIAGVITLGEKNNNADIGIIAVDNNFRGQNIGKALIQEAVNYSIRKNYSSLQVVTQKNNQAACKFYERCGFTEKHVINIYHYWK